MPAMDGHQAVALAPLVGPAHSAHRPHDGRGGGPARSPWRVARGWPCLGWHPRTIAGELRPTPAIDGQLKVALVPFEGPAHSRPERPDRSPRTPVRFEPPKKSYRGGSAGWRSRSTFSTVRSGGAPGNFGRPPFISKYV